MPIDPTALPMEAIEAFCQKWRVKEFALFGSVLGPHFTEESDVDVLLTFAEDAQWGMFDLVTMQAELQRVFNRPVDLVTRPGIEASRNEQRRSAILSSAEVIHAAA